MENGVALDSLTAYYRKGRSNRVSVALNFYAITLALYFASAVVKAILSLKGFNNNRLHEMVGAMPLIAFVVSMHLMYRVSPNKKTTMVARSISLVALLIKINNGILSLFSASDGVMYISIFLTMGAILLIFISEVLFNHVCISKLGEKDAKFKRLFIICCMAEYGTIFCAFLYITLFGMVERKGIDFSLSQAGVTQTLIMAFTVIVITWKICLVLKGRKMYAGGSSALFFKKGCVVFLGSALFLVAYMHFHQFSLKYVYDGAYKIWASGYLNEKYTGSKDITSFRLEFNQVNRGPAISYKTLDEIKKAAGTGSLDKRLYINVDRNNVAEVGPELHPYYYFTSIEVDILKEIIDVGYKFPGTAVIQTCYNVTLDDGNVIPVVISDRIMESLLESNSKRIDIPCAEIINSPDITSFYVKAQEFEASRYEDFEVWILGEAVNTTWLDIIVDYYLKNYSISRVILFLTFFGASQAFIIWAGLREN